MLRRMNYSCLSKMLLISVCTCGMVYATESAAAGRQTAHAVPEATLQANSSQLAQIFTENAHDQDRLIQALEAYGTRITHIPLSREAMNPFITQLLTFLEAPAGASLTPLNRYRVERLLGDSYCWLPDSKKAIHWLDLSLKFFEQQAQDYPQYLRKVFASRGVAARFEGNYSYAKDLLERSVHLYEADPDSDPFA